MYSVFLSSYTNRSESLGELEKAVETLACRSCSHSISRSPKLFLNNKSFIYNAQNRSAKFKHKDSCYKDSCYIIIIG